MATPSDALSDLVFFGLDHGVDSVREGGPLVPFAVVERDGSRELARTVATTLEEGLARGVEHVRAAQGEAGVRASSSTTAT